MLGYLQGGRGESWALKTHTKLESHIKLYDIWQTVGKPHPALKKNKTCNFLSNHSIPE